MKHSNRNVMIATAMVVGFVLWASLAFVGPHALAQQQRPVLILTIDGQASATIIGPKGANDLRIVWGVLTPYGYWTKNGKEIPGSRFQFLGDINDFHFSTDGNFTPGPPVPAPAGANDVEFRWEGDQIIEAWWTRDGQRLERISLSQNARSFNGQFAAKQEATTSLQSTASAQLVGLVYDKESRPGENVTMTLTTDPRKYANIAGLGVIEMKAPVSRDASGHATLEGIIVDLGDGHRQSATEPLTMQIPRNATTVPVTLTQQSNVGPLAQGTVPIAPTQPIIAASNTGKPSDFTTPPVVLNTSVIHGPLSGNGNLTRIMIDTQPTEIIAESPRSVYFDLPPNTPVGSHTALLQDSGRNAQFPIVNMALVMQADQTRLQKGQSTTYTATVRIGPLPDEIWRSGGPAPGQAGVVTVKVENASRDTVSIVPSQNQVVTQMLHQQDFQNGQFTLRGRIQSNQTGGFVLNGLAEAFFAPIPGQEAGGGLPSDGPTMPELMPNPVMANASTAFKYCEKGGCSKVQIPNSRSFWCNSSGCPSPCTCHVVSFADPKDEKGEDHGSGWYRENPFTPPKVEPPAKERIYFCSCLQ